MDDPWATWGKAKDSVAARMSISMSPPPEDLDVADPWAPAKKQSPPAAESSGTATGGTAGMMAQSQAAGAAALASAKEGFATAKERYGPAAANAATNVSRGASAFMGSAKDRMAGINMDDISSGFSSGLASVGSGISSMSSKVSMPDTSGMKMPDMSGKMPDMPSMDAVSSRFSTMSMPDTSSVKMPDISGMKMPDMSSMSSGFSSLSSKVTSGPGSDFSLSNPPTISAVPDAPKFSVPTSVTSSLTSFQSKVQGAATTALAGHISSQVSQSHPGMPSAFTDMASNALASHMTSQASSAITAQATAATASATERANAYTSGLMSTVNSNISSFNSNVSKLGAAASTASEMASAASVAVGPNIGGLGSLPAASISLPSWGDAWGSPAETKQEVRPPTPVRSPSPPAFGDVWGAPEKKELEEVTSSPFRSPSPIPRSPSIHSTPRSIASSPRKSLEARLSRELSRNLSHEHLPSSGSRPGSPLKLSAISNVPDFSLAGVSSTEPRPTSLADIGDMSSSSLDIRADTSLQRSLSVGSGFGGFNDGIGGSDPWGTSGGGDAWKQDDWRERSPAPSAPSDDDGFGGAADGYASWGGVRSASPPVRGDTQQQQWAAAQRAIQLKEERAPFEKMDKIRREWDGVAASIIAEKDQLETLPAEEEKRLDDAVEVLKESVHETLRSLTTLPDTRIPPLHTLTTYQKYTSALTRANANPSTSLLHRPIRPRKLEGLSFGPGLEGTWSDRSRLGEQEAQTAAAAAAAATDGAAPGRWSFWKKTSHPKPLVTSGGGVLEVKTPSASSTPGTPVTPQPPLDLGAVAVAIPAAVAPVGAITPTVPSTSSSRRQSLVPSRPASPAQPHGAPVIPVEVTEPDAPRTSGESTAPTAVSRFWGRWGRRSTTPSSDQQQLHQSHHQASPSAGNHEDLELGADDFSFLADVPSMPTPETRGTADLLGFGGSPSSTLESVLQVPARLPSPLAPPPRGGSRPTSARQSTFVARMATGPKPPQQSAMDLLSDLDFDAPPKATSQSQTQSRPASIIGWDDIMAPSSSTPSTASPSVLAPPPAGGRRTATPPIIAPPGPARARTPPVTASSGKASPLAASRPLSPAGPVTSSPLALTAAMPVMSATPIVPGRLASPPVGTGRIASPPVPSPTLSTPLAPSAPRQPSPANGSALLPAHRQSFSALGDVMARTRPPQTTTPITPMTAAPPSAQPVLSSPPQAPAAQDSLSSFGEFSFMSSTSEKTSSPVPGPITSSSTPYKGTPLNPSVPTSRTTATLSPGMGVPLLASSTSTSGPHTPVHPSAVPTISAAGDDFGDFGDFADFSVPAAKQSGSGGGDFDDFGDFGDFTSLDSPAAPPPVPSKSPWKAPSQWTPSGASNSPAPTPPSKSPHLVQAAAAAPSAPKMLDQQGGSPSPSPSSRHMTAGSVDHRPTLTLLTTANKSQGRWPAPVSPAAPAIPPPPGGFFPPPPSAGGRAKKTNKIVDLMDMDDLL